jgi:signal transduction histidine kinase
VVIEALTNVRRHAPSATTVTVAVAVHSGVVEVTVVDDGGAAPAAPRDGGGTGLAGLDERVRALGGDLHAGPHGAGWRVSCHLPAGDAA